MGNEGDFVTGISGATEAMKLVESPIQDGETPETFGSEESLDSRVGGSKKTEASEKTEAPHDDSNALHPRRHCIRSPSPTHFRKPCTLCLAPRDVLVRCRIDASRTWHFVCPGKCWREASGGGVIDGSLDAPYYRYGGMWKNKHAGVSAKKKTKKGKGKRKGGED